MSVDDFVMEFLRIHPFEDGNGRVGSLIYNIINGTLLDPQTMPDYFGGQDKFRQSADAGMP